MKMHLNIATADVATSVAFYRTLLAAEPVKHYDDYALFITDEPGLELAIDLDPAAAARVSDADHFGIVADTTEAVDVAIARLQAADYTIAVENEETCCYAVQNKVWATDPDGRRWETYFVVEDTEDRGDAGAACCVDETAALETATA